MKKAGSHTLFKFHFCNILITTPQKPQPFIILAPAFKSISIQHGSGYHKSG